jgi:peptide/nickel transport system substrate-binding protein
VPPPADATLRLAGPGNIDRLDPALGDPAARQIVRLLARQLLTYEPRADLRDWQAVAPVPDLALAVPSTYNAGLGASQRSYVLHLRPSVMWDTTPPRPVTAHDVIRGLKRAASPLARPPELSFLRSAIRGMAEFCDQFAAAVPAATATAAQHAAYLNGHELAGVFALDDESLVIEVVRPSPDFVHMLALTIASAAPAEYDAFLPGTPELTRHFRSNGPYRVTSYVPGWTIRLEANPVWRADSDPVRRRPVTAIELTTSPTSAAALGRAVRSGAIDLPWGLGLRDDATAQPDPVTSWNLDPYLVFNVAAGHHALRDVRIRRALAAAVDRGRMLDVCRKGAAGTPLRAATTVVPPHNDGHRSTDGDPAAASQDLGTARALLAAARHARGLVLTAVFPRRELAAHAVTAYADDLARAGVKLRVVGLAPTDFDDLLAAPAASGAPPWDILVHRLSAAWHHRNERVFLEAMFASGAPGNLGGFQDDHVDALIAGALQAAVDAPAAAIGAWQTVERAVLERAPVVPLLFRAPAVPALTSARVRRALPIPALGYACDLAALQLADEGDAWISRS